MLRLPKLALSLLFTLPLSACFFDDCNTELGNLTPYEDTSPYADALVECVQADERDESCRLTTLPAIGMENPSPSVDDIMERVVVSHPWMGQRFEQLLYALPADILDLTQAVTAIVIDAEIRPSYYWNLTGAIYLDPANLWLTQEEKNVISREEDYRGEYVDPMAFQPAWRLVKDGGPAYAWYGLDSEEDRTLDDIVIPMAALLYHELAHANDLLPPTAYGLVNMNDTIYAASNKLRAQYPSTVLSNEDPLISQGMFNLANILYLGATPSEQDKQISATQVGAYFAPDKASDDYAYASQYEDLAMLFEEAMLKIHFDLDRDIAFLDKPESGNYCNDYTIGWGARNRLGQERVKARAAQVITAMLPMHDYSAELAAFPAPTPLPPGLGWCESIAVQTVQAAALKPASPQPAHDTQLLPEHHTRRRHLQY